MKRRTIKQIAPSNPSRRDFTSEDLVWHLGLEHIESQTGRIVEKRIDRAGEAGGSTYVFDEGNVLYSKLRHT